MATAPKTKATTTKANETATKPKTPTNKKYQVNWTLKHDGKTYQKDDTISLTADVAKSLLAIGVISE